MMIEFYKYQATGNDFILLDNRDGRYDRLTTDTISRLCDRRFGIGADGLMWLSRCPGYDFEMVYFNADGRKSTMCGNGGRCMIRFAHRLGILQYTYRFLAADGPHEGEIANHPEIRLRMKDVTKVESTDHHALLDTGSPHFVRFVNDILNVDVAESGREIRNSAPYRESGINVNFVEVVGEDSIFVRTYERGVEDETLSCGTGVTAAALLSAHNDKGFNRVEVKTPGGSLSVEFNKISDSQFEDIWLCGPAEEVFAGHIEA